MDYVGSLRSLGRWLTDAAIGRQTAPISIQLTEANSKRDVQPSRLVRFSYPTAFCAFLLPAYII